LGRGENPNIKMLLFQKRKNHGGREVFRAKGIGGRETAGEARHKTGDRKALKEASANHRG